MSETIPDPDRKIKPKLAERLATGGRRLFENREFFSAILIVFVGVISFGLGRLSVSSPGVSHDRLVSSVREAAASSREKTEANPPISPTPQSQKSTAAAALEKGSAVAAQQTPTGEKKYVGSKNGTKYHLPWCSGAARIAEENKVWFSSKEEAEAAGYTPAANCKGI